MYTINSDFCENNPNHRAELVAYYIWVQNTSIVKYLMWKLCPPHPIEYNLTTGIISMRSELTSNLKYIKHLGGNI